MPKIKIDNKEIEFENGITVLQACEQAGIEVPRFCYHDRLSIAGNCRMCLVEMEKSPKPIASCAMPASDGMIIKTNTDLIKKARKGVMEFLLINHPLDCPICDQGGECDLQDQAMYYGFDRSRYEENKRAVKNKYMGPLVSTIMTRCIHCTRCVRFATEIGGVDDIGMLGRGENAEITTYLEKTIKSELSGNVIDLCPVGALTNKPYAFKARPWELKKTETIDIFDAMGSSIRIDSLDKTTFRVLPRLNEDINEEWISDKTRFAIDGLKQQRIVDPYIKENNKLIQTDWNTALKKIIFEISSRNKDKTTAISGKFTDVETLFSVKKLLNNLGSNYYDCRYDNVQFKKRNKESFLFNSSIKNLDKADALLIIGSNPRWEASVLNSRIRKAYLNNDCKIGIIGKHLDLNYEYVHLANSICYLNDIFEGKSSFGEILKKSKYPFIILGNSAINQEDGEDVLDLCAQIAKKFNVIREEWNGFNILQQDISRVGSLYLDFYNEIFSTNFNKNMKAHVDAHNPVVFLLNSDDFDLSILKNSYVVYIGHHGDSGAQIADVILPAPAYTEKSSTFVNMEGRVLQSTRCYHPLGQAKEEWKIFRSLSDNFNSNLKFNNLEDLREEICQNYPQFKIINLLSLQNKINFGKDIKINSRSINYTISNFYMNDVISRASKTMAECTKKILNKNE